MTARGEVSFDRTADATLVIRLSGPWHLQHGQASTTDVQQQIGSLPRPRRVAFDTKGLTSWDTSVLTFLSGVTELCKQLGIVADREDLPSGIKRLLDLAEAVPEKKDARTAAVRQSVLERVGTATISSGASVTEQLDFLGALTISFGKLLRLKARYRNSDLALFIQQCGVQALGIVTLISFLLGLIFGFVGAVQLQQFGASIYVANLVAVAMTREMGAIMTGIIMAGRTGGAFAAQLGTMKVTQEIDALTTMGISSMEFLVLPRALALILMMPLLCLYADLVGILGGAVVGVGMLDVTLTQYIHQTQSSITLVDISLGVFKSAVFGVLIALSGCLEGIRCGKSASAVGDAATAAVVSGIVLIIVADGLFAVVTNILGI